MREVSIFELQRNVGKQLEELPFYITKYNVRIAMVNRPNVTLNTSGVKLTPEIPEKDDVTLNTPGVKPLWGHCQLPYCKYSGELQLSAYTEYADDGEHTTELLMCPKHFKKYNP